MYVYFFQIYFRWAHTQLYNTWKKNSLAWCHDTVRLSHKLLLLKGLELNMDMDDGVRTSQRRRRPHRGSPTVDAAAAVHTPLRILQSQCKNYYYYYKVQLHVHFMLAAPVRDVTAAIGCSRGPRGLCALVCSMVTDTFFQKDKNLSKQTKSLSLI